MCRCCGAGNVGTEHGQESRGPRGTRVVQVTVAMRTFDRVGYTFSCVSGRGHDDG